MGPESLTTMLVTEIAKQENVESTELSPPLHTTVDMDALEKFFDSTDGVDRVEFSYSGHQIMIENGEELQIEVG